MRRLEYFVNFFALKINGLREVKMRDIQITLRREGTWVSTPTSVLLSRLAKCSYEKGVPFAMEPRMPFGLLRVSLGPAERIMNGVGSFMAL